MNAAAEIIEFAGAILHGDDEHREWLMEAAQAFNAGKPLPPPRGKGSTSKQNTLHDDLVNVLTNGIEDLGEVQIIGPLSWLKSAIDALGDLDKAKAEMAEDPDAFFEMIQELRGIVRRGEAAIAKAFEA